MKIGIISMQRVRNYGSFLQAYGLKKLLEANGSEVGFIDIESAPSREDKHSVGKLRRKLGKIDRYLFKRIKFRKHRRRIGEMFRNVQNEYLHLNDSLSADACDAIVIGSDEIFNCDSRGLWKITPERFGYSEHGKRVISYAASCGYTDINDANSADRVLIERGICRLDAVSVRDENTAGFIAQFRSDEPLRHLDPVLIYDFQDELASKVTCRLPKQPYMVVYAYHNRIHSPAEIHAIRSYARKNGLQTIAIGGVQAWCDEYAVLTPFEVLAYFQNAACIVTDTFHGTVISAKFNQPFAVFVRESNANKLEDLLTRLKIKDRAVKDPGELGNILDHTTDYTEFNEIVAQEKLRAKEYLRTNLFSN